VPGVRGPPTQLAGWHLRQISEGKSGKRQGERVTFAVGVSERRGRQITWFLTTSAELFHWTTSCRFVGSAMGCVGVTNRRCCA